MLNKAFEIYILLFLIQLNCVCKAQNYYSLKTSTVQIESSLLAQYTGTYIPSASDPLKVMEILFSDGKLYRFIRDEKNIVELIPETKSKFNYLDNSNRSIEFISGADKNITSVILTRPDGVYKLTKQIRSIKPKPLVTQSSPCNTLILSVCIDGESKLHIKGTSLFWEHIRDFAPGTHKECGNITKVNNKDWKNWQSPFTLDFSVSGFTVQATLLQKNQISQLIQSPSASNGWETIWYFSDPAPSPHNYAISLAFCPPANIAKPKTHYKKEKKPVKEWQVDTIKYQRKIVSEKTLPYKIYFEPGKSILTKDSSDELAAIYDSLKSNTKIVEIKGFVKKEGEHYDALKLYDDRSIVICNYLLDKGLNQKRIYYLGYGDDKKVIHKENKNRVVLIIVE